MLDVDHRIRRNQLFAQLNHHVRSAVEQHGCFSVPRAQFGSLRDGLRLVIVEFLHLQPSKIFWSRAVVPGLAALLFYDWLFRFLLPPRYEFLRNPVETTDNNNSLCSCFHEGMSVMQHF
ncbi:hypothetical protein SDC9_119313 [bioreactor metagenome]|uniref:Uncharacterized protein n=1 Tax=bioreactor metagenome TaxID=1076179 RepID=A0A645C3J2_9ZZZZ